MRLENIQTIGKCYKDIIAIPFFKTSLKKFEWIKDFDEQLYDEIAPIIKTGDFDGKIGSSLNIYPQKGNFKRILLAGAGTKRKFSLSKLRTMICNIDTSMQSMKLRGYTVLVTPLLPLPNDDYSSGKACAESLVLSRFEFNQFKSKQEKKKKNLNVVFIGTSRGRFQKGLKDGKTIAKNVNMTRTLVNTPSNTLTPIAIAEKAEEICKNSNALKCTVFDEKKIEKLGLNGIIAVGKASINPPRFVIIEYAGTENKKEDPIVIVGKGVSFDSGGISLKPWSGMDKMKTDMAGAGAVLGIMKSVAELNLPQRIVGLIPTAENMPGARAYKPGDIIKMGSGTTVEILSTDAEGRLLLADALYYGRENFKPKAMIDLATLTGACAVSLGNKAVAIMGNNKQLIKTFQQNADKTDERVWELPMWPEFEEMIKSDSADIKNTGGPGAGTIMGAVFLKAFVKDTPWVHVDIANMAWQDSTGKNYICKGASGVGVRLVCEVLQNM